MFNHLKLSQKIFLALFLVILLTAVSILMITLINYRKHSLSFAEENLKIKEREVLASIDYELDKVPVKVNQDNIFSLLQNSILGISDIHKTDINVFDTRGNLIISTESEEPVERVIPKQVLDSLSRNLEFLKIPIRTKGGKQILTTYRYLNDIQGHPIAIVNIPYKSDDSLIKNNMHKLLNRYAGVMIFILIFGGFISWFLAKKITQRIDLIAAKIKQTDVVVHNRPIGYEQNDEFKPIVDSYNEMLDKLNHQSNLLALTEREDAWREMAKQVAHEIKNPLTPMRMLIQNYVRKYNPDDPNAKEKLDDLSETLISQIDTMSAIAEAFSDFARLPVRNDEEIDVAETIRTALEVFPRDSVQFNSSAKELKINFDRIYLIRIITNLVKNSIQAIPEERKPEISVSLQKIKDYIIIRVTDNGMGIPPHLGDKIFEPKFTTTTGGTGLGLAMVKKIVEDYNGEIRYISEEGRGTEFIIRIPYVRSVF
ncbi:MAG: ATP-binding protein [Moheibacter sp.]